MFDYHATIVYVVFWLFVAAVCLTPMIVAYKIRQSAVDTIKLAIEKGQDLSPDLVRQLTGVGSLPDDQKVTSVNLKIAGAIVMAAGIGAALVATVFLFAAPVASPFVYGGAAFIFCIGVGLHMGAKALRQHEQEKKTTNTPA